MEIRRFTPEDYDEVHSLWQSCNLSLEASDSKEEIVKFATMNPDTSLVGTFEDKIIACVLGGFDGRRGLVHHLSVDEKYQGYGYGAEIMKYLENIFKDKGVIKISFWVIKSNINVVGFYEKLGYELRNDIVTVSKKL